MIRECNLDVVGINEEGMDEVTDAATGIGPGTDSGKTELIDAEADEDDNAEVAAAPLFCICFFVCSSSPPNRCTLPGWSIRTPLLTSTSLTAILYPLIPTVSISFIGRGRAAILFCSKATSI